MGTPAAVAALVWARAASVATLAAARAALQGAGLVVSLTPFKDANAEFADVLLPAAPFSETAGTFVNAEGRVQGFHAVVKPLGETRPAWKVLRVLANMLGLPGFDYESAQAVLVATRGAEHAPTASVQGNVLGNATSASIDLSPSAGHPAAASIYQLDGIVRRAPSLQLTADAKRARAVDGAVGDRPPPGARTPSGGSAAQASAGVAAS